MFQSYYDEGFGTNGFQIMGVMNALKTGDIHIDMLIAMGLPIVLRFLLTPIGRRDANFWKFWSQLWARLRPSQERTVSHRRVRNPWGHLDDSDNDSKNSVLLKAIRMYLHQVVKLPLTRANLDLTQLGENNDYESSHDDDDHNDDEHGSRKTLVGVLSRYKIISQPPEDEWHDLGSYGEFSSSVWLRIEEKVEHRGDPRERNQNETHETKFCFKSKEEGAIDNFIEIVYQWYMNELRKQEDNSRYLYEPFIQDSNNTKKRQEGNDDVGPDSSNGTSYKRYKLSDEKTFDSLFFKEKDSLLGLLNHFSKKSGKYSIKGYPHKLGLLLHGPPGTGKTSLIKALAQYTGRSIVNIPLSRVSTNKELMSLFFDTSYRVEGAPVPVKMDFKDVIFVMEDVDTASKIVQRRDGLRGSNASDPGQAKNLPVPKSLWRLLLESPSDDCKVLVKKLTEMSERLKKEEKAQRPEILKCVNRRLVGLPALGLLDAEEDDLSVSTLCEDAIDSASNLQGQYSKLDEILSSHAELINGLLDSGFDVNDDFVDDLLGNRHEPLRIATLKDSPRSSSNNTPVSLGNETYSLSSLSDILIDDGTKSESCKSSVIGPSAIGTLLKPKPDQLNLSGLLNVLDGVVDTPGRIVIMTTNHPEMLDPALIRPGRVDKKLLLGYMRSTDIVRMLELYFSTKLDAKQIDRVKEIVNGTATTKTEHQDPVRLKLTPAQVEQLAAEHDRLEDMIAIMAKMSSSSPFKA